MAGAARPGKVTVWRKLEDELENANLIASSAANKANGADSKLSTPLSPARGLSRQANR